MQGTFWMTTHIKELQVTSPQVNPSCNSEESWEYEVCDTHTWRCLWMQRAQIVCLPQQEGHNKDQKLRHHTAAESTRSFSRARASIIYHCPGVFHCRFYKFTRPTLTLSHQSEVPSLPVCITEWFTLKGDPAVFRMKSPMIHYIVSLHRNTNPSNSDCNSQNTSPFLVQH